MHTAEASLKLDLDGSEAAVRAVQAVVWLLSAGYGFGAKGRLVSAVIMKQIAVMVKQVEPTFGKTRKRKMRDLKNAERL